MNFDIGRIGICVEKPIEMADWYRDTLGFHIKFCAEEEEKGVAFITDNRDGVMLETGQNPRCVATSWQNEPPPAVAYCTEKRRSRSGCEVFGVQGRNIHRKMPYQAAWRELDSLERPMGGQHHTIGKEMFWRLDF